MHKIALLLKVMNTISQLCHLEMTGYTRPLTPHGKILHWWRNKKSQCLRAKSEFKNNSGKTIIFAKSVQLNLQCSQEKVYWHKQKSDYYYKKSTVYAKKENEWSWKQKEKSRKRIVFNIIFICWDTVTFSYDQLWYFTILFLFC